MPLQPWSPGIFNNQEMFANVMVHPTLAGARTKFSTEVARVFSGQPLHFGITVDKI